MAEELPKIEIGTHKRGPDVVLPPHPLVPTQVYFMGKRLWIEGYYLPQMDPDTVARFEKFVIARMKEWIK